jgi:hypothetical protein
MAIVPCLACPDLGDVRDSTSWLIILQVGCPAMSVESGSLARSPHFFTALNHRSHDAVILDLEGDRAVADEVGQSPDGGGGLSGADQVLPHLSGEGDLVWAGQNGMLSGGQRSASFCGL